LNLRELCDVAYVMLVDRLESRTLAEMQAAVFVQAMGGNTAIPDPGVEREQFDAMLTAPFRRLNRPDYELRKLLGVGLGGGAH
jgi:hypothetical protein